MQRNVIRLILFIAVVLVVGEIIIFIDSKKSHGQQPEPTATLIPSLVPTTDTKIDSTTGWKVLTNKKYNYIISYPPDWQVLDEPNVNGIEIQKVDKLGGGFSLSVRVLDNPQRLSVKNFANAQVYPRDNGTKDSPQPIIVSGETGYKLQYLPPGLLLDFYLPYKDSGILNVFAGGSFDPSQQSSYNSVVNQMVSSLKLQ